MTRPLFDTLTRSTRVTSACLTLTVLDQQVRDGNAIGSDFHRCILHHCITLQIPFIDTTHHQHTALVTHAHCKHVTHTALHELVEHWSQYCAAVVETPNTIDLNMAMSVSTGHVIGSQISCFFLTCSVVSLFSSVNCPNSPCTSRLPTDILSRVPRAK